MAGGFDERDTNLDNTMKDGTVHNDNMSLKGFAQNQFSGNTDVEKMEVEYSNCSISDTSKMDEKDEGAASTVSLQQQTTANNQNIYGDSNRLEIPSDNNTSSLKSTKHHPITIGRNPGRDSLQFQSGEFGARPSRIYSDLRIYPEIVISTSKFVEASLLAVDSRPLTKALERFVEFYNHLGVDVQVRLYQNEQDFNWCGYVAIMSLALKDFDGVNIPGQYDWLQVLSEKSLFDKPDKVIEFFNDIIGKSHIKTAAWLLDSELVQIILRIEFLALNFNLPLPLNVETAFRLHLYIKEIQILLMDASNEIGYERYQSLRDTKSEISRMSQYCLDRVKSDKFRFILRHIQALIDSHDQHAEDFIQAAEQIEEAVNSTTCDWFAGIFSPLEFKNHVGKILTDGCRNEETKWVILNTKERPGEHWFAVRYNVKPADSAPVSTALG